MGVGPANEVQMGRPEVILSVERDLRVDACTSRLGE
jgi:hypothetical protein